MSLRTDRKKIETGKELNAYENNMTDIINQLTAMFVALDKVKTYVENRPFFTASEKAEITEVVEQLHTQMWQHVYDNTPVEIRNSYPVV